jgi:hypothetical protein
MTGGLPPIRSSWRQTPRNSRPVIFPNRTLAVIILMLHPLWREDGSLIYSCCWHSPAQSLSCPSPSRLMTTFYCLKFETSPTWRARSPPYLHPPGNGWSGYTSKHQTLGSLFVASYDSQGYGGGIRPRLHTGKLLYDDRKSVRVGPNIKHRFQQFLSCCVGYLFPRKPVCHVLFIGRCVTADDFSC